MKIAITGGTGFVGRHLAERLLQDGHEVVILARGIDRRKPLITGAEWRECGLGNVEQLAKAFEGCDAVAHCAGINRELGSQTYQAVHAEGTRNVVEAARRANVRRLTLLSFLRARPNCGSPYHESKFAAEEIVRESDLDFTILKAGMIYGDGDHFLDHVSHALHTFPIFLKVGFREQPCAPLAVEDVVRILVASLVEGRLTRETVWAVGPEAMPLSEAVLKVGTVIGKRPPVFPAPIGIHYFMAGFFERLMTIPLESKAQVRILSESLIEPTGACDRLPVDLVPATGFTGAQIRKGLPPNGGFSINDCLCRAKRARIA